MISVVGLKSEIVCGTRGGGTTKHQSDIVKHHNKIIKQQNVKETTNEWDQA